MKSNVRRITDGALISALMGVLIVLDGQSGLLIDGLLFWIIPIPILIYTVKYDVSSGLMVSVATFLLAFILSVPTIAILIGFSNMIGLAYGYGISKKLKMSTTLFLTFITTFIYYIVTMVTFAAFFGYDPIREMNQMIDFFASFSSMDKSLTILRLKDSNPFFKMLVTFPLFLPLTIAALQTMITNMAAKLILVRLKLAEFEPFSLFNIRISKKHAIILLVVLFMTYLYTFSNAKPFLNVIILVQFVIELVFIILGVILLVSYAILSRKPYLSVIFLILTIGVPYMVMFFGIADSITNVRVNLIRRFVNER